MTGIVAALAGSAAKAAFVATEVTAGSSANSIDIALPAGAAAGDHVVYVFAQDAGNTGTLSSDGGADATLLTWGSVESTRIGVWSKTLTAADITNGYVQLTFAFGAANQGVAAMGLWRGGPPTFSLAGQTDSDGADGATATLTNPSGVADYFAFAFLDDDQTTISAWPTSYTQGRDQASVGTAGSGGTAACAVALAADPGAETFVFNTSDEWVALVIKVQ